MKKTPAQLESEIEAYRKASVETIARHFYLIGHADGCTDRGAQTVSDTRPAMLNCYATNGKPIK